MDPARTKVLIVGEGVTAAHVIRPLGLALGLDSRQYEVTFACDPRYGSLVSREAVAFEPIDTIARDVFLARLDRGSPLYTLPELQAYVRDDLRLITRVKPDIVVGDFRISMGISAELSDVPYLALSNMHWSPNSRLPLPVPEHPLVKLLGVRLAGLLISRVIPFFLKVQARATNRLRRWYGLKPINGQGAPEVYTRGTRTLYFDVPELYGSMPLADTEHCIGPVMWAPSAPLPAWWWDLPADRPVAWVSAGSSGDSAVMEMAAAALIEAGITVMVATAGRMQAPAGAYVADFIPGLAAAGRADIVVCNGGSGLVYQALACGKPVLGVPRNMDQYYVMEAVERQGAGRILRSGTATAESVQQVARAMLRDPALRSGAERLARAIAAVSPAERLQKVIGDVLSDQESAILPTAEPVAERWETAPAEVAIA